MSSIPNSKMVKRLALQKWRFLSKKDYANTKKAKEDLELHNPRLFALEYNCSYCEEYFGKRCFGCPLKEVYNDSICCSELRQWQKFNSAENAKHMYQKIKALP